jgi:curli biogenesis system outer membrane secretion channel CsgG
MPRLLTLTLLLVAGVACAQTTTDPVVDHSAMSQALAALPPRPYDQRVTVTIFEFRSGVPEVNAGAATDMFTTALIKSGQFRVVERQRLQQDIVSEKQLNAAGQTTGDIAKSPLRGAQYIFEGVVSEANASEDTQQASVSIAGMQLGKGTNKDRIAIDVRIVDANTGDILDSIDVSKVLNDTSSGVSGTAALVGAVAAMRGRQASPFVPDVNVQNAHKEGVSQALRACLEMAVLELVKRVYANAAPH